MFCGVPNNGPRKLWNDHLDRSSQRVDVLDHGVDVLPLVPVGRPEHEGLWHPLAPHLSDDLVYKRSVYVRLESCLRCCCSSSHLRYVPRPCLGCDPFLNEDPSVCVPQPSFLMRFLPAVGYALSPAVGPLFPAAVALFTSCRSAPLYQQWVRSFLFFCGYRQPSIWSVLPVDCCSRFTCASSASPLAVAERCSVTYHVTRLCLFELCPLPGVATFECVSLSLRAWQGLGCLDELFARPRADPRAPLSTLFHVLLLSTHLRVLRVACWTAQHHSLLFRALCVEVFDSRAQVLWFFALTSSSCSGKRLEHEGDRVPRVPLWSAGATVRRLFRFGLRAAVPPKLCRCDSPQLSPLRLAVCLMVSGHFSTQTY